MAKKILFFSVSLIFIWLINAYAASAYGVHMPKEKHWTWGLEANFLIDRNLDNEQGATSGNRYFLTGSYGIYEWLSFDGKIGAGNVHWDKNDGDDLGYSTNFAGGYGFRIKGYGNKELGIKSVIGFQHISVHPVSKNQGGDKHEVIIDDWQGSVVVSKDAGSLVPYLGARYGTVDFIKWVNEHDRKRIKSEKFFGLVIGADYWIKKDTKINIEGIFIDGEELSIGISMDF